MSYDVTQLQVGEIGKQIIVDPQLSATPNAPPSLAGMTCSLVALDPSGNRKTFAATVSGDAMTASYLTVNANDFPLPGNYRLQLIAQGVTPAGQPFLYASPVIVIGVGERL